MSLIAETIKAAGIPCAFYKPTDGNDGLALVEDGQPLILIADGMPMPRRRFTAAHELGHILLGHLDEEGPCRTLTPEARELEANIFASVMVAFTYALELAEVKERMEQ